jgi:hypothetical protein
LVNPSCKYFTKIQTHRADNKQRIVMSRALNPRFLMPHFGQKTGFRARMNEINSGIPCSGHVIACVCILVNPSCKYFTKIQTHRADNKQRIVMSWRAFVFW